MASSTGTETASAPNALFTYSERAVLHQHDVVASTELWRHDVAQSPHAHEFMEIVIVKTGTAVHRMRSGERRIAPGSLLLIRPGHWHAYEAPDDFSIWNLYIPYKTLESELAALRSHPVVSALTTGRTEHVAGQIAAPGTVRLGTFESTLMALSQPAHRADRSLTRLGQLLIVLDALGTAFATQGSGDRPAPMHPAVIAATELLDSAPARAWSLAELAEAVHVSSSYLCRLFTRELGISPLHYLERHRLEHTAQLLLEGDLSIGEISASTGWSDSNYMTRRFRATYGMSPSRYREVFQRRRNWARQPSTPVPTPTAT